MTCIVGFIHNGTVYMGGDSAGVAGLDIRTRKDPKVFIKGEFIFGFTSSFRMGQLLRHSFTAPARNAGQSVDDYMAGPWIDAVRKCLKDGGYASVENNTETGGQFLVGYAGRLFQVDSDFQVGEVAEPYDAVGCGHKYALGTLHALHGSLKDPKRLVRKALESAAFFSAGVRAPFTIEVLRP